MNQSDLMKTNRMLIGLVKKGNMITGQNMSIKIRIIKLFDEKE